ncbi:MAG: ribonuclease HI [Chitinispirillia bacterium]|nr:ribonuclease HI [Chitinispirillia bacterium]MCL2268364.1 ribonuclease HI [Chitinispirillia bacterium]
MKTVYIYSDGACTGNPGPGGYGAILRYNKAEKELSGGFADTTNNRMELMGVIVSLEALREPCEVIVITDSQYVVNGIEKGWAAKWKAHGWMRNSRERAQNPDLWERLLNAMARHRVRFEWIRGHAGHRENERCDKLAVEAAHKPGLPPDVRG